MNRLTRLLTSAALGVTAVSGCGVGSTKTVTVNAPSGGRQSAVQLSPTRADERIAVRNALLGIGDMPEDWAFPDAQPTSTPADSRCKALERAKASLAARAASGIFTYGVGRARHYVYSYETPGLARGNYDGLRQRSYRRCYAQALQRWATRERRRDGETITDNETSILKVSSAGDATLGFRVRLFRRARNGETWADDYDTTITLVGRALSILASRDIDGPDRRPVVRAAADKVEKRFGG